MMERFVGEPSGSPGDEIGLENHIDQVENDADKDTLSIIWPGCFDDLRRNADHRQRNADRQGQE